MQFISQAHIWAGREVEAEAAFLNTGSVSLSTDTPGVTIEAIPAAPPVTTPALHDGALALLALLAVPIIYTLIDDAQNAVARRLRALRLGPADDALPSVK